MTDDGGDGAHDGRALRRYSLVVVTQDHADFVAFEPGNIGENCDSLLKSVSNPLHKDFLL